MLQDVINIDNKLARAWIMPVIQGYVEIKQCQTFFKENKNDEVCIIRFRGIRRSFAGLINCFNSFAVLHDIFN